MEAPIAASGHEFIDLNNEKHEISFSGIVDDPKFSNTAQGKGPKRVVEYETQDGTKHRHEVSQQQAKAILLAYCSWKHNQA